MSEFPSPPVPELQPDDSRFVEIAQYIENFKSGKGAVPPLSPLFDQAQLEIDRAHAAGEISSGEALVSQKKLASLACQWAEVLGEKLDGAQHDKLTGFALNDLFLQKRDDLVRKQREALAANPEREFYTAVFVFDVNSLKMVNDRFGHAAGNRLIQEVSQRIRQSVDEINTNISPGSEADLIIGRTGGDEFVLIADQVFAQNTSSDDQIAWVTHLERILRHNCSHFDITFGEETIEAAVSIGLAHGAEFERRPDKLQEESDACSLEDKARHYFLLGN